MAFLLKDISTKFETISVIQYIIDVFIIMIIMCMLVYLSFSIVKKSQLNGNFQDNDIENKKVKEKIDIKNQIEIIQNGIVMSDFDTFIYPTRRVASNHIFDETMPKIKHLNSLKYEEYNVFNNYKINENNENLLVENQNNNDNFENE